MRRFVQNQPYVSSSCDAVTEGKSNPGLHKEEINQQAQGKGVISASSIQDTTAECWEQLWWPYCKDRPGNIWRIQTRLWSHISSGSCLIVRGFCGSGYAAFPRGGRDNSAPVCNYLWEEENLIAGDSWPSQNRHTAEAANAANILKQNPGLWSAPLHSVRSMSDVWIKGQAKIRSPKQKVQVEFGCASSIS